MNIPIPAETADPNIDQPTLPPSEPEPVAERQPPGSPHRAKSIRAMPAPGGDPFQPSSIDSPAPYLAGADTYNKCAAGG